MSTTPKKDIRTRRRPRTRVVLIDEFAIFAEALGTAISNEDDLDWVGSATTPEAAVEVVSVQRPDVAVVDIDVPTAGSPEFDGIAVTVQIKAAMPELRVLILSGRMEVDTMARAAADDACGFLSKTSSIQDICQAIRTGQGRGHVRRTGIGASASPTTPTGLTDPRWLGRARNHSAGARSAHTPRRRTGRHGDRAPSRDRPQHLPWTREESLGEAWLPRPQLEAVVEAVHQGLLPHLSR